MANRYGYLGTATAYPITISKGAAKIASGLDVVENAIIMILMTPVGTRPLMPEYGSKLTELIYEPNDEILGRLLDSYITEALSRWEKRIRVLKVGTLMVQEYAVCRIEYRVLSSNEIKSLTYPFFRGRWLP